MLCQTVYKLWSQWDKVRKRWSRAGAKIVPADDSEKSTARKEQEHNPLKVINTSTRNSFSSVVYHTLHFLKPTLQNLTLYMALKFCCCQDETACMDCNFVKHSCFMRLEKKIDQCRVTVECSKTYALLGLNIL